MLYHHLIVFLMGSRKTRGLMPEKTLAGKRSEAGRKAALTRKRRKAGAKAALTKKRLAAGFSDADIDEQLKPFFAELDADYAEQFDVIVKFFQAKGPPEPTSTH
jgi:hypothetical protein